MEKGSHQPIHISSSLKRKPLQPKVVETIKNIPKDILTNRGTQVGIFWSYNKPLTPTAKKLLIELVQYYTFPLMEKLIVPRALSSRNIAKLYELSDEMKHDIATDVSLRSLEWLVTNHSKANKIILYNEKLKQRIDIHNSYEVQSNFYKRCLFDPFCRSSRVYFTYKVKNLKTNEIENVVLVTTIGQLNFMRWANQYGILDYARAHHAEIQKTMEDVLTAVNKEKKLYKKLGQKRKRRELTQQPELYCTVYNVDTTLHFDHLDSPLQMPCRSPSGIDVKPCRPMVDDGSHSPCRSPIATTVKQCNMGTRCQSPTHLIL